MAKRSNEEMKFDKEDFKDDMFGCFIMIIVLTLIGAALGFIVLVAKTVAGL